MILTTAYNYGLDSVRPFLKSLYATGYDGEVVMVVDPVRNRIPDNFEGHSIRFVPLPSAKLPLNTARFFAYEGYLRTVKIPKQLLLTDVRDVIFQTNPEKDLPQEGLHAYCECEKMTIEKCPYNSKWMRLAYSEEVLDWLGDRPIICAGVIVGGGVSMLAYITRLCAELVGLPPTVGLDQAAHNVLMRTRLGGTIHLNNDAVFTVGYVPRNTVVMMDWMVRNACGIPCVVHQYDRHPKLKQAILEKYS